MSTHKVGNGRRKGGYISKDDAAKVQKTWGIGLWRFIPGSQRVRHPGLTKFIPGSRGVWHPGLRARPPTPEKKGCKGIGFGEIGISFGKYFGNENKRMCVLFSPVSPYPFLLIFFMSFLDRKTILFPHYTYFVAFFHLSEANFLKKHVFLWQYMKNNLYFCLVDSWFRHIARCFAGRRHYIIKKRH